MTHIEQIKNLRNLQKMYFKCKNTDILARCKEEETKADYAISIAILSSTGAEREIALLYTKMRAAQKKYFANANAYTHTYKYLNDARLACLVTVTSGLFIQKNMTVTKSTNPQTKFSNLPITPNSRNELIPIIKNEDQQFVDARILHRLLKVKSDFNNWITNRIKDYGFEFGVDFRKTRNFTKSITKPITDYLVTFDMAKELAMVERNEQGRLIRRWFIAKEKELRAAQATYALPSMTEALKSLKPVKINGQRLYNYREVRVLAGYSHNCGGSSIAPQYRNHVILFDNKNYITEDYANHLLHTRAVYTNRKVLAAAQGILPLDFGDTTALIGRRL